MKKTRMIVSAIAVFAVVGSALAFKAKTNPNLYTCPNGLCVSANFHTTQGTQQINNPGNLYIADDNGTCGDATLKCSIYGAAKVWRNQ